MNRREYRTCVTAVGADMIDVTTIGQPEQWVPGAAWIQIRIGKQNVPLSWTTGPLPAIGDRVTITVEASTS